MFALDERAVEIMHTNGLLNGICYDDHRNLVLGWNSVERSKGALRGWIAEDALRSIAHICPSSHRL